MAKKPKRHMSLTEKQLGYTMVLPSLILIFAVVIWPITQSFWNSLFDYKLNDPAKSQKMLSDHIDLERYANNFYYLSNSLENLQESDEKPEVKEKINNVQNDLDEQHAKIMREPGIKEKYKKVNDLIASFKPVTDSELKYSKIDSQIAQSYISTLEDAENKLSKLQLTEKNTGIAADLKEQLKETKASILQSNFIGFKNYLTYFKDQRMWQSIANTSVFTVISVFFELVIGLLIALLLNRVFFGRGIVRAAVLIPWAIPTAVSAMMWKYLYDGQSGIIAHYFEKIHLVSNAGDLLTTPVGAMFSIIFTDVWKTTPYMSLLLLAGLQTIPSSLYEAAQVDGANKFQQFFKITLPLLKSSVLVALLFRTLDAFRVFDLIYVLTGGGPANSTESITVYAYKTLFSQQNFGAGSVLSVIVFLAVALISMVYIKFIGSDLFEGKVKN
ncbi:ABC transporter permease subunit [Bacillus sp. B-jedd]|uniref:ABC transporter permease subunit n=1 Tax=Bacillus sp. B-jedd TaxID=1476857 RepID=UPI00051569D9|nr:ABC transporter permease subunit [Bacillus sp. B-jedd]CEG27406.1 binding-protein-dependent transporter inner membrane component [Bacillus sp. B-jedd]